MQQRSRYESSSPSSIEGGWTLERMTPPSALFGANGIRNGPDGRIYIAECVGSRISALDVQTGALETISPIGGDIVAPDDLAFDESGDMYVTETMDDRVSVLGRDRASRVLQGDLPGVNGITFFQGRLFVDESVPNGRLLELPLCGGEPRVVLEGLTLPNALDAGPDGRLYYPLVGPGEIWRVHPDTCHAERVIGGLHHPTAVKVDSDGFVICTLASTGGVLRIDPRNGDSRVLARLDSPLDNLTLLGERLFVSHMVEGRISEVLPDGTAREMVAGGLHSPLDLSVGDDGRVYVADQVAFYTLLPTGGIRQLGRIFDAGFMSGVRGLAALPHRSFAATTANGRVAVYHPWVPRARVVAEGLDRPYGIVVASDGGLVVAELGAGRLLSIGDDNVSVVAGDLQGPTGVALGPDGSVIVSEAAAGRVSKVVDGLATPLVDGLQMPQGIAVSGSMLYIVDAGAKAIISVDLSSGERTVIATGLPIGAPPGVEPKPLRGTASVGPLGPFAGITVGPDGTLYFSADAEGSVMALRPPLR